MKKKENGFPPACGVNRSGLLISAEKIKAEVFPGTGKLPGIIR